MFNESKMTHQDALKILGATGNETSVEMSKLFKRASLRNHPDRGGSNELMQQINQAYDVVTKTNPISGARSETSGDVRARHAAQKQEFQEKMDAYYTVAKNYFSTKFNALEFSEYFTKYTGQPTTFTFELKRYPTSVQAFFKFRSGEGMFDFIFICQPPVGTGGLAAPDASALGTVSVDTDVLVGAKKHKMARREYQWGKNPDKITPESLFPAKKLQSIFSPVAKDQKYKRADYMLAFHKHLDATVSGNDIMIPVGGLNVYLYRHVMMRKGAYVFQSVVDPAVNRFRPAVRLRGTVLEDEDGACLDMILDTFKELRKIKPDAQGIANAVDRMNAEFAAGHRSASFVKRVATQAAAPKPEEKEKRQVNRIGKEDYYDALKQVGVKVMSISGYAEFDNGAGITVHMKRSIVDRKGVWVFDSFNYMHGGQRHVEWLKNIEVAEDTKGASISLIVNTMKELRGVADWYTAGKLLEAMGANFKAGKFSTPHVKKESEQKRTEKQAKDELGAQPTNPTAAKKNSPEVDTAHQKEQDKQKTAMNAAIRKMLSQLVKAGRKDTPEEIKKAVDEAIATWRLTY